MLNNHLYIWNNQIYRNNPTINAHYYGYGLTCDKLFIQLTALDLSHGNGSWQVSLSLESRTINVDFYKGEF